MGLLNRPTRRDSYNLTKTKESKKSVELTSFKDRNINISKSEESVKCAKSEPAKTKEPRPRRSSGRLRSFFLHQLEKIRFASFTSRTPNYSLKASDVESTLRHIMGKIALSHPNSEVMKDIDTTVKVLAKEDTSLEAARNKFEAVSKLRCGTFDVDSSLKGHHSLEVGAAFFTEEMSDRSGEPVRSLSVIGLQRKLVNKEIQKKIAEKLFNSTVQSDFLEGKFAKIKMEGRLIQDKDSYYEIKLSCDFDVQDNSPSKHFEGKSKIEGTLKFPITELSRLDAPGIVKLDKACLDDAKSTSHLKWSHKITGDLLRQNPPKAKGEAGPHTSKESSDLPQNKVYGRTTIPLKEAAENDAIYIRDRISQLHTISRHMKGKGEEIKKGVIDAMEGLTLTAKKGIRSTGDLKKQEEHLVLPKEMEKIAKKIREKALKSSDKLKSYSKNPEKNAGRLRQLRLQLEKATDLVVIKVKESPKVTKALFAGDGVITSAPKSDKSVLSDSFVKDMDRCEMIVLTEDSSFLIGGHSARRRAAGTIRLRHLNSNESQETDKIKLYNSMLENPDTADLGTRVVPAATERDLYYDTREVMPDLTSTITEAQAAALTKAAIQVATNNLKPLDKAKIEAVVEQELVDLCEGDKDAAFVASHLVSQYGSVPLASMPADIALTRYLLPRGKPESDIRKVNMGGKPYLVFEKQISHDINIGHMETKDGPHVDKSFSVAIKLEDMTKAFKKDQDDKYAVDEKYITIIAPRVMNIRLYPDSFLQDNWGG